MPEKNRYNKRTKINRINYTRNTNEITNLNKRIKLIDIKEQNGRKEVTKIQNNLKTVSSLKIVEVEVD